MKNIAVFVDFKNGILTGKSLNLIQKVNSLGIGHISVYTFSKCVKYFLPKNIELRLITIDSNSLINISDKGIVTLVVSDFKKRKIDLVFASKSVLLDSLLAQIAIIFDFKIKSQIVDFNLDGNTFLYTASIFNNKALAQYANSLTPSIYIVNSNFKSTPSELGDIITIDSEKLIIQKSLINLKSLKSVESAISLSDASIVIGAGRGMKDPSNWKIIEELAESLKAATACSKPVSDLNWRPHHEHVGQTGVKIAPDTYIACGISGAIQHLAGVNTSKIIVVINNDPEAPFFKNADYGIVADLFDILPRLTKKIKSRYV